MRSAKVFLWCLKEAITPLWQHKRGRHKETLLARIAETRTSFPCVSLGNKWEKKGEPEKEGKWRSGP